MNGIADEAFETWQVQGVECAMLFLDITVGGYVRVPKALRDWWEHHDEVGPLLTPRELTYGPDEGGWIGFDTGKPREVWDLADLEAGVPWFYGVPLMKMQQLQDEEREALGGAYNPRRIWTLAQLRAEVGRLAAALAAVAAEVENPRFPL